LQNIGKTKKQTQKNLKHENKSGHSETLKHVMETERR